MGTVYADITLKNGGDLTRFKDGNVTENNIRSVTITAVVDTGAMRLMINEDIRQKLGLEIIDTKTASLAGDQEIECKVTEPVLICWKDRYTTAHAVVLPKGEPLLGVIPLEDMDLIVDPGKRELIGAHGDRIIFAIK